MTAGWVGCQDAGGADERGAAGMAIDPICGMEVDEARGLRAERDGRTYFFCCEHCRRQFLSAERTPKSEPGTPAGGYFCPMCAGVESDAPGVCPRCGMALEATVGAPADGADAAELRSMHRRFWVALALGLPVLVLAMGGMVAGGALHRVVPAGLARWLQLVLTTPVVLWAGGPFFQRAARALAHRRLNMFTLIALGIGVNVLHRPEDFPPDLRDTAGSLAMAAGGAAPPRREAVFAMALTCLDRELNLWRAGAVEPLWQRWVESCNILGRQIHRGGLSGRVVRVDPDGALIVQTNAGAVKVRDGDIVELE